MKLKFAKPKTITRKSLFGLILTAIFLAANIPGGQVSAAMSFDQLEEKFSSDMRNYCAPVPGEDYNKCTGHFTAGASAVYNASSEAKVNNQLRIICTGVENWIIDPVISDCSAFAEGVTTAQSILGKKFYNGGGAKPDKKPTKKPDKKPTKKPKDTDKPPPISECAGLEDPQDRKDCKKEYRACNKEKKPADVRDCKKDTVQKHKKKQADKKEAEKKKAEEDRYKGKYLCGNIRTENNGTSGPLSDDNYYTKFNFGCVGENGPKGLNPIEDLAFAFLRFLSVGVGIAVVIAVVGAGIQYTASEGNAEVTTKAKKRVRSAIIGLMVYIFAFSLFQYLVPGGIFKPGDWISVELIMRLLL